MSFYLQWSRIPTIKSWVPGYFYFHFLMIKLCKCTWYLMSDEMVPDKFPSPKSLQAESEKTVQEGDWGKTMDWFRVINLALLVRVGRLQAEYKSWKMIALGSCLMKSITESKERHWKILAFCKIDLYHQRWFPWHHVHLAVQHHLLLIKL